LSAQRSIQTSCFRQRHASGTGQPGPEARLSAAAGKHRTEDWIHFSVPMLSQWLEHLSTLDNWTHFSETTL